MYCPFMILSQKVFSKKVGENIIQQSVLTAWPGQTLVEFSAVLNAY